MKHLKRLTLNTGKIPVKNNIYLFRCNFIDDFIGNDAYFYDKTELSNYRFTLELYPELEHVLRKPERFNIYNE